ncbi:DUF1223 domain-containing protein [Aggregatimonas sangjinii]|uniref:DUF1223 domain-containing protein n=1 Tax=Aggregatimonas sangjinii TaxID=2583587 RepID=A0A5B7SRL3_9FLAO|nr:DUF1223 domain-containing protein [Aggregatimonas sangjinii]QCW99637.1 DUF1223 domain-containing protein [Aggregatimonas sangjinii]
MLKRFFIPVIVVITMVAIGFTDRKDLENIEQNSSDLNKSTYEPIVVLELFTSQGCSSCPAADRLLEEVKERYPEQVFTLSYHVDYWNYIGWQDPFSSSEHAKKQRIYNEKLKYNGNYTPEVVVNGKWHFTGSNRVKMNEAIAYYKKERVANDVAISKVESKNDVVVFHYKLNGNLEDKILRAILVLDERTTEIKRGENRDRTIKNTNIVVAENQVTLQADAGKGRITVPKEVRTTDKLHLILLVENNNHDITAAAKKAL